MYVLRTTLSGCIWVTLGCRCHVTLINHNIRSDLLLSDMDFLFFFIHLWHCDWPISWHYPTLSASVILHYLCNFIYHPYSQIFSLEKKWNIINWEDPLPCLSIPMWSPDTLCEIQIRIRVRVRYNTDTWFFFKFRIWYR